MLKRIIAVFSLIILTQSIGVFALESVNEVVDEALRGIPTETLDVVNLKNEIIKEGKIPTAKDIVSYIIDALLKEGVDAIKTLAVLICPILLMGLLENISLNPEGVSKMAGIAAYIAISGVIISVFSDVTRLSRETVDNINVMSGCMIPVMYSLMLTSGKVIGYTTMQPTVIFATGLLMLVIQKVIFPLVMLCFSLNITDNISGDERFKSISTIFTKVTKWMLILMISLFTAILSAQNILTHSFDTVAMKGTKFAVANFIPVIGGAISEGTETIGASLILIKNATGIAGILAVLAIALVPVLKIYLASFMFFVLSGISRGVSGEKTAKLLDSSGGAVSMLGAIVLSVSFLFVISVAVILGG